MAKVKEMIRHYKLFQCIRCLTRPHAELAPHLEIRNRINNLYVYHWVWDKLLVDFSKQEFKVK